MRRSPSVVPGKRSATRDPYVDGPLVARVVRVNPIACDHMSGLLSRSHMTAAKMGSATRGPNNQTASFANGSHGLSRVLGSIDHTHLLEQAPPPACGVSRMPNSVIRLISWRSCWAPSLVERTIASLTPMAARWERVGHARSRLTDGHRRRRLGLDGACPALNCRLAERSVVARAAGCSALR